MKLPANRQTATITTNKLRSRLRMGMGKSLLGNTVQILRMCVHIHARAHTRRPVRQPVLQILPRDVAYFGRLVDEGVLHLLAAAAVADNGNAIPKGHLFREERDTLQYELGC